MSFSPPLILLNILVNFFLECNLKCLIGDYEDKRDIVQNYHFWLSGAFFSSDSLLCQASRYHDLEDSVA
jgi:hypothetical protein